MRILIILGLGVIHLALTERANAQHHRPVPVRVGPNSVNVSVFAPHVRGSYLNPASGYTPLWTAPGAYPTYPSPIDLQYQTLQAAQLQAQYLQTVRYQQMLLFWQLYGIPPF